MKNSSTAKNQNRDFQRPNLENKFKDSKPPASWRSNKSLRNQKNNKAPEEDSIIAEM